MAPRISRSQESAACHARVGLAPLLGPVLAGRRVRTEELHAATCMEVPQAVADDLVSEWPEVDDEAVVTEGLLGRPGSSW